MTIFRAIPLSLHAGLEALAGPAVMAAPFLLGFGTVPTVLAVLVGILLVGLSLQVPGPQRSIPLAYHASFDYAVAALAAFAGLALGALTGDWVPASFLVGIGAAQVALTASTRFSVPFGAR